MTGIPSEAKVQQDATAKPPSADASHEPSKRGSAAPELDPPEAPRQEDSPSVTEVGDSSREPNREHDTPAKQDWVLLSEASISFAIDTSGSTLGSRLHHEQEAIRTVSSLLNDPARDAVRVLPWSSHAGAVSTLSGLSSLSSYGGTDPEALLNDGSSLTALQNSSCWFLLTDGEIPEISKVRFARTLSSRGLHGTACVVIIFGEVYGRPTACNISVGVSVFAATPDCLFMFKDTQSENYYLLQCKGTFSEILEQRNQLQPLLNDDTTWEDLPRISLKELSCVRIPDHRNLHADEIYFDSDLIVNLVDLLAGRISNKKVIDALLDNPSHLRTLTTTAQTRGMAEGLRQWVIKQELDPSELLASEVPEVEERGVSSMTSLMQRMRTPGSIAQDQQDISRLQTELRASNSSYRYAINARWADAEDQSRQRSGTLSSIVHRSYSDTNQARSLSLLDDVEEKPIVKSNRPGRRVSSTGFVVSEGSAKAFEGACPLCAEQNTPMALLLREPPRTQTQDFPAVGSNSKLAFPLAMGNFRETDIICPALYCDGCANTLVKTGSMVGEDKAIVSLTLVPYSGNERAYDRLLKKAFQQRFDSNDAPMVFIAVLCMTLRRLESKDKVEEKPLCSALRWACRDLVQSVQCQDSLTRSTSGAPKCSKPLNEVLRDSAEAAVRSSSMDYFQYPIEGFVVMTDLLKDLASTRPQLRNMAKKTVFQRLLFHVTERFDKRVGAEGRVIMHLEMVRVLLLEQGRRDRALGSRQFSSFRGLAGLTKSLFGDRKSLANRLSLSFEELVAASLLDHEFLVGFKKLGPLADSVESQSGHAMAIFVHYLYRSETKSWPSSAAHYMALGKTPALASVLLEPFEISAGKAEGLIAKLPPWDTVGEAPDHS